MEVEEIKNARITAFKERGIKLRYVTEITADNLEYCKEMLTFSEVRHLNGIKGNFEVSDEKEYVAVATLHKAQPIPQLIFSNVPEIVEQQQFVFDSLWHQGIPAEQKIDEIEKGIVSSVTTILNDYEEAEKKEFDIIRKAKKEIQIIYSTASAYYLQEKSGVLELLKQKAEQQENLHINMLIPLHKSIKESLSLKLLTNAKNNNIHIQDIAPSIDIKIKSLVTDRKESLIMEIKESKERKLPAEIGFSIYSNSIPTVLTYCSIFEMIGNQGLIAQELKHEREIKDDFINTAAHELRTPTQAITGYAEMNEELLDDFSNNREKMTNEDLVKIMTTLQERHKSISRNASRLNILTNNLLDVARFESNSGGDIILHYEEVDLVKEIRNLIELEFSQKIENKGIEVVFINDDVGQHCWVRYDKMRLNQILINLIDNAIKFSKSGDKINIIIKDDDDYKINTNKTEMNGTKDIPNRNRLNDDMISEDERKSQDKEEMVYVGISDTGRGISPKIYPKLFEKFVTDSDFGTGLGLFLSKKLVETHGGKIWAFNNADGVGATFVFSLPKEDGSILEKK